MRTFVAYVEQDLGTRLYVGTVPGVPGVHTQAASLDELQENLRAVRELCLEELGDSETFPSVVGLQQGQVQT